MSYLTQLPLCMYIGTHKSFAFQVKNPNGTIINLTSATISFVLEDACAPYNNLVTKVSSDVSQIEIKSPSTDGTFYVKLVPADTSTLPPGTYKYGIRADLGTGQVIALVAPSKFELRRYPI